MVNHLDHHGRGHGKADPDRATIGRQNGSVHTDHIPLHVEERTAGVAAVDRCIGLDVVIIAALQRPAPCRHDTGGDREALTERVAHGHDPIANARGIAVAKGQIFERLFAFDFQQGDVRFGIGADDLCGQIEAFEKLDHDLISALDDVIIRHDIAILGNHETRPQSGRTPGTVRTIFLALKEIAEEILKRRAFGHDRRLAHIGGYIC